MLSILAGARVNTRLNFPVRRFFAILEQFFGALAQLANAIGDK
jgi:hypothetical protein